MPYAVKLMNKSLLNQGSIYQLSRLIQKPPFLSSGGFIVTQEFTLQVSSASSSSVRYFHCLLQLQRLQTETLIQIPAYLMFTLLTNVLVHIALLVCYTTANQFIMEKPRFVFKTKRSKPKKYTILLRTHPSDITNPR